jgi:outer membrane receptor protein involved in Fe transport
MLDRIEILTDGGSALYGSDAIAGVVNLIMRTDFVGAELYGDVQQIQGAGSSFDSTISGIWGWESPDNNAHFVISGEYFERDPVPITEASFYDQNSEFRGSVTGVYGDFTPFAQPELGANLSPAYINGPLTAQNNANRAAAGLAPVFRFTDPLCGNASLGIETGIQNRGEERTNLDQTCSEDTTEFTNLFNGEKRQSITGSFNLDIGANHEFYSFYQYSSNEIQRLDTGSVTSLGPGTQLPTIGSYSPVPVEVAPGVMVPVPLGDLFFSLGSHAAAVGNPTPVITNAPISGANGGPNVMAIVNGPTDLPRFGGNDQVTESDTVGTQFGFRGEFTLGNKSYNYDTSYSFSTNSFEEHQRTIQRSRLELAYNGLGGPDCVPNGIETFPTNIGALGSLEGAIFQEFFPGYHLNTRNTISLALTSSNQGVGPCQFFNPYLTRLTNPNLANSQELIDWLTPVVNVVDGRNKLGVFDFVVSGELFDMPAGPLQFAVGFQHRDQQNRSTAPSINDPGRTVIDGYDALGAPNAFTYSSDNLLCSLCTLSYDNKRNIRAFFTELSLPLAENIETQIALRYEDYGGGIGAELSPKFAISWRPIDSLIFRGSYSQAFRAPNVGIELQGYRAASNRTQDILSSQDVRAGVSEPILANAEPEQVFTLGRASPDLGNETAQTYNLGFQWAPNDGFLDGFSIQADFWRFELEEGIVPQPITDALQGELDLFIAAAADPSNYVVNATLEPGQTLTPCDPNNLPEDPGNPGAQLPRGECVVNPAAYQIVGVQRALNSDGNLITAVIGAVNAGEIISDGVDFKAGYNWTSDYGIFNIGLDYTFVNQYKLIGVPGLESGLASTGVTDAAGTTGDGVTVRSLPDHKGHISLGWNYDRHSASIITRYTGSYRDLLAPGIRATANPDVAALADDTIDSYQTWDVQYNYAAELFDTSTVFTVGVLDIFEEEVPYRETAGGFNYDTVVFDGRGRRIYARALIQFD